MIKKFLPFFLFFSVSCGKPPASTTAPKPLVLVSIAPYHFLAAQIGGDAVEVQSVVPPNTNPHIFEPTSRQATRIAEGVIWFQIGEPFEEKLIPFLKERNPHLVLCDLREKVDMIAETNGSCHHCSKNHLDRHIWLSPKWALVQAKEIERTLSAQWPQQKEKFEKNLHQLQSDLLKLDLDIASRLAPLQNRTFLVSHPAFGYFCKEYGLEQISVEYEGKDPRPRHLETISERAKTSGLKVALILPQYNNKGTLLIAKTLDLQTHMIDPYSNNYLQMLKNLTEILADE